MGLDDMKPEPKRPTVTADGFKAMERMLAGMSVIVAELERKVERLEHEHEDQPKQFAEYMLNEARKARNLGTPQDD